MASSSTTNRDITVVVVCFNYGRFVGEAVESALTQQGGPPQVIVVDDGSTEPETDAALSRLPAEVELVRQANEGVCAARNAGLRRAVTPYALVLDADDRLAPGGLAAMRAPLDRDPSLGFSYGYMRFFGDWRGVLRTPPYDPFALLFRHTIGLSALMRRDVVESTGGYDPAFDHYEDWELWLNALAHGWPGQNIQQVTLEYRRHGETKHGLDRRSYRKLYRQLRSKHGALYRALPESEMGLPGRLMHRLYWGPRPLPARLESLLWRLLWQRRGESEGLGPASPGE